MSDVIDQQIAAIEANTAPLPALLDLMRSRGFMAEAAPLERQFQAVRAGLTQLYSTPDSEIGTRAQTLAQQSMELLRRARSLAGQDDRSRVILFTTVGILSALGIGYGVVYYSRRKRRST